MITYQNTGLAAMVADGEAALFPWRPTAWAIQLCPGNDGTALLELTLAPESVIAADAAEWVPADAEATSSNTIYMVPVGAVARVTAAGAPATVYTRSNAA